MSAPQFACLTCLVWDSFLSVPSATYLLCTDFPSHSDGSLGTFSSQIVFWRLAADAVIPVSASTGILDSSLAWTLISQIVVEWSFDV